MPDTPTSVLDSIKNFARATMSGTITSTATTLYTRSGQGAKFPNTVSNSAFNIVIWDSNTYPDPSEDPKKEIVRCTRRTYTNSDKFTIVRPASGNSYNGEGSLNIAYSHTNAITTYSVANTFSKKMKDDMESSMALVGCVVAYCSSSAPTGWLKCDGTAYNRTSSTYSRLYSLIGTKFGSSSSATFKVPDMRGRVVVGIDATDTSMWQMNPIGVTGGSNSVTLDEATMPFHSGHVVNVTTGAVYSGDAIPQPVVKDITAIPLGGNQPHNNLQPYLILSYIIKY